MTRTTYPPCRPARVASEAASSPAAIPPMPVRIDSPPFRS